MPQDERTKNKGDTDSDGLAFTGTRQEGQQAAWIKLVVRNPPEHFNRPASNRGGNNHRSHGGKALI
jgi:hypothetical protein